MKHYGLIEMIVLVEFLGADLSDVEQLLQADINAMRDTIDSDGLEMLRDPNLIITSEPNAEDTFRLDRLDCEREIAEFFNSH